MQTGWQDERDAQAQYGRSQCNADEVGMGVSSRPFGSQQGFAPRTPYGRPQPRQFRTSEDAQPTHRYSGHMAFLKSLQQANATIRLVTIHDEVLVGQIKNFDETTISIRVNCPTDENPNAYQNHVFFKQNLVEFAPVVEGVTFS